MARKQLSLAEALTKPLSVKKSGEYAYRISLPAALGKVMEDASFIPIPTPDGILFKRVTLRAPELPDWMVAEAKEHGVNGGTDATAAAA